MYYKLYLFLLSFFVLISCKQKTTETDINTIQTEQTTIIDTLTYEQKRFEFLYPDCEISEIDDCQFFKVDYVLITDKEYHFINDTIQKMLVGNSSSLENSAKSFLEEYEEFLEEMPSEYAMKWASETTMNIHYNDNQLFSYEFNDYMYMGGAHGMYGSFVMNVDLKNKSTLKLYDLINEGDSLALKTMAMAFFREDLKIEKNLSIQEAGYFWEGEFYITDNFIIRENGLEFIYNPYEIAAYAAGMPMFTIPFEDLKPYFTENSPLKRVVN